MVRFIRVISFCGRLPLRALAMNQTQILLRVLLIAGGAWHARGRGGQIYPLAPLADRACHGFALSRAWPRMARLCTRAHPAHTPAASLTAIVSHAARGATAQYMYWVVVPTAVLESQF